MTKQTALVTGGSRGIGAAICEALARADCHVWVNYNSGAEAAAALVEKIRKEGGSAEAIKFDVGSLESIGTALSDASVGQIDVLVNNAGVLKDNLIGGTPVADWRWIVGTNFVGSLNVFKATAGHLAKSSAATVINIASISGLRGGKGQAAYAASKAMLIEWTQQLAHKAGGDGGKVFAIAPGAVATEMIRRAPFYNDPRVLKAIPVGRFAEPSEIGATVLFLLNNRTVIANGATWVCDGGFTLAK